MPERDSFRRTPNPDTMTAASRLPLPETDSPAGIVVSDACSRSSDTPETDRVLYVAGSLTNDRAAALETLCRNLEREVSKLREELDWQNMPNRREPFRGGWEFYINEEWTGIRDAALGEDPGFRATLMKVRYDPDDERVRVRRVLDDDAILQDLAEAHKALDSSANK